MIKINHTNNTHRKNTTYILKRWK